MVKLETALEARLYGPALAVRRWEYINAGAYMFGTLLLAAGLPALCTSEGGGGARDAGLTVVGVALAVVAAVNAHDLGAHLAGVDCHVGLARFDHQLGLVELLAPALHAAGCVVAVVGLTLQLFSKGDKLERRASDALLAGAVLWLLGSMLSLSQSSFAACSSSSPPPSTATVSPPCQARAFNVLKLFVMHQSDAPRLEKLRGDAQERLARDREGRVLVVWRSAAPPTDLR